MRECFEQLNRFASGGVCHLQIFYRTARLQKQPELLHERMQLPQELLKSFQSLLDKPLSPTTTQQLQSLLQHQHMPLQKCLKYICTSGKHRCDLLIFSYTQLSQKIKPSVHAFVLSSVLGSLLEYRMEEVLALYGLVLGELGEEEGKVVQAGYTDVIKLALKITNLETKDRMFRIILSNLKWLQERVKKRAVKAIVSNYLEVFRKFVIYLPSYVGVVTQMLKIDQACKQLGQQPNCQNLDSVFIDLSSQELDSIKSSLLQTLTNTSTKLNYYQLHKECLSALRLIAQTLLRHQLQEADIVFNELAVGEVLRVVAQYVDRKGTLDEARLCRKSWQSRASQLSGIRDMKSQKHTGSRGERGSGILRHEDDSRPILIEEAVMRANDYRMKYQVSPEKREGTPGVLEGGRFLRKGDGVGGGRTWLASQSQQSSGKASKINARTKIDLLVEQCVRMDMNVMEELGRPGPLVVTHATGEMDGAEGEPKLPAAVADLEIDFDWQQVPALHNPTTPTQSVCSSMIRDDDEQVQQISNLIELAYSYKFS